VAQLFGGQRWRDDFGLTRYGLEVEEEWLLQEEGLMSSPRSDGASLTYAAWCLQGENLDRFVRSAMSTSLMSFLP
jgi:hypothetical protein